jgi:hypothetical protein
MNGKIVTDERGNVDCPDDGPSSEQGTPLLPPCISLPPPASGIYRRPVADGAVEQGELLSDVVQQLLNADALANGELVVDAVLHPFVIVLSQSCDLQWDAEARHRRGEPDKLMPSILLCEALTAGEVKGRKNVKGQVLNPSEKWTRIRQNNEERFHFFEAVQAHEDAMREGLPELVIDFKRYFTMPCPEFYLKLRTGAKRRAQLQSLYAEHFATRFFQYQSRIATPRPHYSQ